jgi:hypothetical protein
LKATRRDRAAAPAHHGDPDALQDRRGRRSRSWKSPALFLDGKQNVRKETSNTIALSPMKARPAAAEIVVLRYR